MDAFHILTADGMFGIVDPYRQTVVPLPVGFKHFAKPYFT